MKIVETCWGPREIHDHTFWHLVPKKSFHLAMLMNNICVGKGALLSISAAIEAEPHIENAQTPYSISKLNDVKENIFEQVRLKNYPELPPRLKSLYIFDEYSLVEKAQSEWFHDEPREVLECRIINGSKFFKADTFWLNGNEHQWRENAVNYWEGKISNNPFPEVLVHGAIFFPKWEEFVKNA